MSRELVKNLVLLIIDSLWKLDLDVSLGILVFFLDLDDDLLESLLLLVSLEVWWLVVGDTEEHLLVDEFST